MLMSKIKKLSSFKHLVRALQKRKKTIVFTNGCFDILHPGHIKILRDAKRKGDILVVGLNSDSSIKRIKGDARPIMNQDARGKVLEAIEYVDYIIVFNEDTPLELIKKIKPDYLVKGEDWASGKIIGSDFVKKVFRVKFYPGYSTTSIVQKIKNG